MQTLGTDDAATFELTDDNGRTLTITKANIATAGATNFGNATLAQLAAALNTAIDADTGFAQMDAAVSGDTITFTQEVANAGQITSVWSVKQMLLLSLCRSWSYQNYKSGSDTVSSRLEQMLIRL